MSNNVSKIKDLIVNVKTKEEAVSVIADAFKHISSATAKTIVLDIQDFIGGTMSESELSYRLDQAGITA